MKSIKVYDIIHHAYAAYHVEGNTVFNVVEPLLKAGEHVKLSFEGIEQATYSFLFATYGRLYSAYGEEQLSKILTLEHTDKTFHFTEKLNEVIDKIKNV